MKWLKKGWIFNTDGAYEWNKSHAQVPVADILDNEIRIYYSSRDSLGKSNISFIEVDKKDPKKIIYKHSKPILEFGKIGTFDDSGVIPSSIVNVGS